MRGHEKEVKGKVTTLKFKKGLKCTRIYLQSTRGQKGKSDSETVYK